MAGHAYTIFDTSVGRCGIAWGRNGVVSVRLPEPREIETRRQLMQQFPDIRDLNPPDEIATAIESIAALLRGQPGDVSGVMLDTGAMPPFQRRIYDMVRAIPRGETRSYAEIAARLGASGAVNAVGQAIRRNPFSLIVPCHRALEIAGDTSGLAANGSVVTRFRLLSIEGAFASSGPTLMDVLFATPRPRPQV